MNTRISLAFVALSALLATPFVGVAEATVVSSTQVAYFKEIVPGTTTQRNISRQREAMDAATRLNNRRTERDPAPVDAVSEQDIEALSDCEVRQQITLHLKHEILGLIPESRNYLLLRAEVEKEFDAALGECTDHAPMEEQEPDEVMEEEASSDVSGDPCDIYTMNSRRYFRCVAEYQNDVIYQGGQYRRSGDQ